jgi:tol-pal system protein YbgF
VEREIQILRVQTARADSARAAELSRVLALQQRILDSLESTRAALGRFRADVGRDLLEVQQQLVQIQELSGQSQRALAILRSQLDDRAERLAASDTARGPPAAPADTGAPATPTPDQLYRASLREFDRSSLTTARAGFQEFVRTYPTHPLVPDALFYVAETFATEQPDSAWHYYREVVNRFATSERAPTALYKNGLIAEQVRRDRAAARALYQRVLNEYPRSIEAALARDRLAALRP